MTVLCVLVLGATRTQASEIEVQALFTDAAMLKIQGKSKLLKIGHSYGGVTLLEADSRSAVIEIAGERRRVTVSQRISTSFETPTTRQISIPRDAMMQ